MLGEWLASLKYLPIWLLIGIICLVVTFMTETTSNVATTTLPADGGRSWRMAGVAAAFISGHRKGLHGYRATQAKVDKRSTA